MKVHSQINAKVLLFAKCERDTFSIWRIFDFYSMAYFKWVQNEMNILLLVLLKPLKYMYKNYK